MDTLSRMSLCCTVDNMRQFTSDGTLNAKVNCLVCSKCGFQESFVYRSEDIRNALFSYVRYTEDRVKANLPLFDALGSMPF